MALLSDSEEQGRDNQKTNRVDGNGKRWTLRSDEHGMNMFDMSSSFFGYVLEMDGIQSDSDFLLYDLTVFVICL